MIALCYPTLVIFEPSPKMANFFKQSEFRKKSIVDKHDRIHPLIPVTLYDTVGRVLVLAHLQVLAFDSPDYLATSPLPLRLPSLELALISLDLCI